MIQDIAPHRYDVTFCVPEVKKNDYMLIYHEDNVLCHMQGAAIAYPFVEDIEEAFPEVYKKAKFLFKIDDVNYFGLPNAEISEFCHWKYLPKEYMRKVEPVWKAFAGITGYQIHKWHLEHQFCSCCGGTMKALDKERAVRCSQCGKTVYPQICPSVIVAITNGDQILMTKYAKSHSSFQKYALVAGYAEIGDSLEDTVRREVWEEVGLRVKNIRYYKSQPWSFTDTLLVGFFCETDGDTKIRMDKSELSAAEWFHRDALPVERSEAGISLTGEMIEFFQKNKTVI